MNLLRRPKTTIPIAAKADGHFYYLVGPGGLQEIKSGNPLLDRFHGIGDSDDGTFSQTDSGYAKAYQAS